MAEVVVVRTASFDSLLRQFSTKFDQAEASDVIHELKRLYPTRKDSFDQTNLYGALTQLYELGAIDDDGDQKLLEFLAEKTSENTKEILKLLTSYKEASSPRQDDFVGRDADVSNILKLVKNHRVPGVNLFGDSGVGKTTLAKEVSKKLEKDFEPVVIDLRGTKDTKTVYFEVLQKFKLTPWDYSKERIYTHLQDLRTKTLLILDNVEQFLTNENEIDQNRRKEFLEFLRTIMSSEASKRGSLKVILTSRIQIKDSMLDNICFSEYEVRPLTKEASRQMLSWRLNDETSDDQDIKALVEIVVLCRNTPYLLKGAEQLQRQNYSKPSKVLEKLSALKSKGVPDKHVCNSLQFDSLPSDPLKQVAVKISLLQRPFSVSTAMEIADISLDYSAKLDLEMLVTHKILTAEDVNGERKYDLHALFREFVTSYLCNEDSVYKHAYEKAENQFAKHFFKIFTQLAKKLNKDFVGTYKELEEDKANLELFIDLATRKETLELILQSEDVEETGSVAILFEAFKSTKERRKLFGEWAKIMEKKESWLSSANFRCWESIQLADMDRIQSACEALERAEMSLANPKSMLKPEKLKAAKGLCKYCSGRIKFISSANLIDESGKVEKERLLGQALCDLKQSLAIHKEVYGDHTLTARTLNLIGDCYMECGKPIEALTFYQEAMDMKVKLVGDEKHFDIPTYYNQLSQVYETLGKEETSWSSTYENYEKAAQYLEKALSLQEELGVNDTVHTATFQRNFANILIGLEKYDQALEYAQKSFEIRNALLGKHPETVRILYLIGVIHELKDDYEAALASYEEAFVMEESLPEDNHSVVRKLLCDRLAKLANILIGLQDYDRALKYGQKSLKIRNKSLGKHPETVRILYLIGIIHEWRNDHKAALASYEEALVMEESLPEDNHSVVRKLLCDRLEAMCKKLNKKDKLEEHGPRMEKICKVEDIPLRSQHSCKDIPDISAPFSPDDYDDLGVAEISVDEMGGSYTISRIGVFLYFPPSAVAKRTVVTCKVRPKDYSPSSVGADEFLVSNIVELVPNDVDILQPINVALMHSGPGRDLGYETVVKVFNQDKGAWQEIKEFKDKSHLPKHCECDHIQVQISKLTILAVVTRLITDRFQVTPKGCVVRSSVCDDVTIEFPQGAVDKTVEGTMKLILVDSWKKENGYPLPILCVDGFDDVHFQKLPIIKLPQPCPEKYSESKICVLCLEDSKTLSEKESQWKDITEQIHIEENEYSIQLHVSHFSWLSVWKCRGTPPIKFKNIFKYFSPPRNVCFAVFKTNDDSVNSFKLGLLCVDNKRLLNIKELKGYPELTPQTGERTMRKGEKARVEINGDFKQDESNSEPVFLQFLGEQPSQVFVYICKRGEIGDDAELEVCFNANKDQELRLCKLVYKVNDIPCASTRSTRVTPNFNLRDEDQRWIAVVIGLNKTLLPPLRDFLKKEMYKHYDDLKTKHSIDNQSHRKHLNDDHGKQFHYESINNNKTRPYDYNVKSAEDLGKLYLTRKMAKFAGFDDTCDMYAVLGILSSASVFPPDFQKLASDVQNEARNPSSHYKFLEWDDTQFTRCFQLMRDLLQALKLPEDDEKPITDELGEWETIGISGGGKVYDVIKFIKMANKQITRLLKEVQNEGAGQRTRSICKALENFKQDIDVLYQQVQCHEGRDQTS